MVEKMSSDLNSSNRASNALIRRDQSIKSWKLSDTAKEKPVRTDDQFTIKFDKGTVFLSAVASGDLEETEKLLDEGVDIDYTNVDGLTGLHQACIDENEEMVHLLLDRHANIEARDNEGWTPLHAAASAGNVDIAQILIDRGADLAAVNNEGEVPLDLAEEDEMEDFLSEEIDAQNLEVEDARNEEERIMIEDATSWLNDDKIDEVLDWQGATALHVAASKGYNKVISLLLQIGTLDVNVRDNDDWTPIHAAVHWGKKTACELLTEAGANFDLKNSNGQTPCDLAEPEFVKAAENCRKRSKELAKKPNFAKNKRIDLQIDVNDNTLQGKESDRGIENLKKTPVRPIVKGSRANFNHLNNTIISKTIANDNEVTNTRNKKSEVPSGESGKKESVLEKKPVPSVNVSTPATTSKRLNATTESSSSKVTLQNSTPSRPAGLTNHDDKKDTKTASSLVSSRLSSRLQKEPEKPEPKKEEITSRTTSRVSLTSRLGRTETKPEEKKTEEPRLGKYSSIRTSTRDEKDDDSINSRIHPSLSNSNTDTRAQKINSSSANADTSKSSIFGANRSAGSDWRLRLAERTKDADNDAAELYTKSRIKSDSSDASEKISTEDYNSQLQKENDNSLSSPSSSERVSPHTRRVAHRNLRETRRSTGVVFLPANLDDEKVEDENESSEPEVKRNTSESSDSRMSIAERLRKKNEALLSSSDRTSERTSLSDRTSISDRYSSSRDRDNTSSITSSIRSNRISSTTSNSDTGDTKDLQRKLDQALKEVQDYKSKYDKMKQEKEDLEKQLEQYKEDIDKMQELKSDNLRLKDENGALIRVISKLSRTPAT